MAVFWLQCLTMMNIITASRKPDRSKVIGFSLIVGILFIVLSLLLWKSFQDSKAPFEKQCVRHGPKGVHTHPTLKILIDGMEQEIPKNIGVKSFFCMRPLHTHDKSGRLHIESKIVRNFTIRDFFTIWNKRFTKSCIFEYCINNGTLKMSVNGKENLEFENFIMHDGDNILVEYTTNGG